MEDHRTLPSASIKNHHILYLLLLNAILITQVINWTDPITPTLRNPEVIQPLPTLPLSV
jgi:hypothetical protein